eukprot:jgi/Mesen1/10687/ME000009S10479
MQDVILLPQVERLCGGQDRLVELTGMKQGPTSLLAKLRWLDTHKPGARATYAYAAALLEEAGLSHWLPKLAPIAAADKPCGEVSLEAAQALGAAHLAGLPVFHACGDAGACTLGCGAGAPGLDYVYLGTSGWVAGSYLRPDAPQTGGGGLIGSTGGQAPGGGASEHPAGVFSLAHVDPALAFKTGSIMTAGGNLTWLLSALQGSTPLPERVLLDELAGEALCIRPGSGGLLYLPFLQGERCPFEDGDARAAFVGISADTSRGAMCRSVMEGVAFGLKSAYAAMAGTEVRGDGGGGQGGSPAPPLRMVGGGARSLVWPRILADVFRRQVDVLSDAQEVGVRGAALLAGRWLGWHTSLTPPGDWVQVQRSYTPDSANAEAYEELYELYGECASSLRQTYRGLSKFRR